jgi:diguanylate cyclase (GGDEF)-like protein
MNRTAAFEALVFLLLPRSYLGWAARLLFWCGLSTALYLLVKNSLGHAFVFGPDIFAYALTAMPMVVAAMAIMRHWQMSHDALKTIANTDGLTGLLNRRAFFDAVNQSGEGALMILDLDHFKAINDRFGHAAGDEVLRSLVGHLDLNLRRHDIIGRIGGEEFGVYLQGADSFDVDRIGERLCSGFVLYNEHFPIPTKVTMSAGAAYLAMARSIDETYNRADEALYQAKRSGRAQLLFWQPTLTSRS